MSSVLLLAAAVLASASPALAANSPFSLTSLFTPPAVVLVPEHYDGFELRFKRFTFRPAEFKTESALVAVVAFYLLVYYLGKRSNQTRSYAWIKAHSSYYGTQFTKPFDKGEVLADGPTDFTAFSTGRRGLYSLHTTFTLLPRHDIIQQLYVLIRGIVQIDWQAKDEITLDFTLRHENTTGGVTPPGFVWAVVNKDELKLRNERWDLGLFTKTTDAIPLHQTLQAMTENTDINNVLLKSGAAPSLLEVLKNGDNLKYFRSLIVTDQPSVRPDTWELEEPVPSLLTRPRHVVLTLSLPSSSDAASTLPIVRAAFELVDVIGAINGSVPASANSVAARGASLQTETLKKLKVARKDWDALLEKERTSEKVAEEEDAKRLAKKRAEDERIAKLPAAEQQKLLEKERKRSLRKAQMRQVKK